MSQEQVDEEFQEISILETLRKEGKHTFRRNSPAGLCRDLGTSQAWSQPPGRPAQRATDACAHSLFPTTGKCQLC